MTDGLDALTITNQKARIKALEDENESLRKVVSDWIYLHSLVSRENKEKGQLLFAKDQTIEFQKEQTKIRHNAWLEVTLRKDMLEEWLTEYRDQLKKENVYHKNTGIINDINELLNGV